MQPSLLWLSCGITSLSPLTLLMSVCILCLTMPCRNVRHNSVMMSTQP